MPSRRGFAKLTTDDGAEDSDGTEIIEDDASSPGVDRGAFGEMFALAQSVGADDAEVEEAASAVQDTGAFGSMFALAQAVGADDDDVEAAAEEAPPLPSVTAWSAPRDEPPKWKLRAVVAVVGLLLLLVGFMTPSFMLDAPTSQSVPSNEAMQARWAHQPDGRSSVTAPPATTQPAHAVRAVQSTGPSNEEMQARWAHQPDGRKITH